MTEGWSLVAEVAHELRTPLATVRMAADVVYRARDTFEPGVARSAELLVGQLDRYESLLADLLELARADAGATTLDVAETDVVALVSAELEEASALAAQCGSELTLDAPAPCTAVLDSVRVRRIVSNLLSNALDHGEGRPVEVHVRAGADAVAIAVRDHGIGFAPEQAERVFERFWRADPGRPRRVGGSGLGLAVARRDAELHGGRLEAWGRPGAGAQFVLTLPVTPGVTLGDDPWPLIPGDA